MSEVTYEEAMAWLDKHHGEANRWGDHKQQRIIEYIQEILWCYTDMSDS